MQKDSSKYVKLKDRILTIKWAYKMALKMNAKVFIIWTIIGIIVSVLPSISLIYYKRLTQYISNYIGIKSGQFYDVIPAIIVLGIVLILTGLSSRVNGDLLYMIMYDDYHIGMQEMIMDCVQNIEIQVLASKEYNDEYHALLDRAGSLTDFMSGTSIMISKIIGCISLLLISYKESKLIFFIFIFYIITMVLVCLKLSDNARLDMIKVRDTERKLDYIQKAVTVPGIAKELRIYDTKDEFLRQWDNEYKKLENIENKLELWRSVISFLCGVGLYIFMSLILLYSIYRVYVRQMSVDEFLMIYMLAQNMEVFISSFSTIIQNVDRGLFSLERQRKFIENVPMIDNEIDKNKEKEMYSNNDQNVVIKAKNISFSYDNKQEVLHNLSFEIHKGETIALIGSNGSGKSTLVKLLIDLYHPTKGTLEYKGLPYDHYSKNTIGNQMGMFFQNFNIYHASLAENIGFGDIEHIDSKELIIDAMEKGGTDEFVKKKNIKLKQWLRRDVIQSGVLLSGGEKQRVAVSRTYMSNKDIMIFDEPAAALDPLAEMEQFKSIKNVLSGKVAILISHRVGFARLADRIFVMDKGKLVEVGTHDELMKKNGVYTEFFTKQAEWYEDV